MDAYIGEIKIWPAARVPVGWMWCDGGLLKISEHQELFALIGHTYGGDGVTNFALPNLRGRAPLHMGAGAGLTAHAIGGAGGSDTVTLLPSQLPTHDHYVFVSPDQATTPTPVNNTFLGRGADGIKIYADEPGPGLDFVMDGSALTPAGGSQPHSNTMPSIAVNFIISVSAGTFPPKD